MLSLKIYFFGSLTTFLIGSVLAMSQQDFLAWSGTIAAGISLLVMGILPLLGKIAEEYQKIRSKDREARKADCEESLKRQEGINADLIRRVATLERERDEWQKLYDAGSSKEYPKLG